MGAPSLEDSSGRPAAIVLTEPVAAVGYPPGNKHNWNGGDQRPPDGQHEVCYQSEHDEDDPKDLLLHDRILSSPFLSGIKRIKRGA